MKLKLILAMALLVLATSPTFAQAKKSARKESSQPAAQAKPHRIVYDVTAADTTQQAMLMRQLNNVKHGWPDAEIEIVVHARA